MAKWVLYERGKKGKILREVEADEFILDSTGAYRSRGLFIKREEEGAVIVLSITGNFKVRKVEDEGEKKNKGSLQPRSFVTNRLV